MKQRELKINLSVQILMVLAALMAFLVFTPKQVEAAAPKNGIITVLSKDVDTGELLVASYSFRFKSGTSIGGMTSVVVREKDGSLPIAKPDIFEGQSLGKYTVTQNLVESDGYELDTVSQTFTLDAEHPSATIIFYNKKK